MRESEHWAGFDGNPGNIRTTVFWLAVANKRKGGRVVEGTALEKRHTRKGIESSNLSLSAVNVVSEDEEKVNYFTFVRMRKPE